MSTSGPNGVAGLWPALDRALTAGAAGRIGLQNAQHEQQLQQGKESALAALMRGLSSGDSGGPVMPQLAQQKLGAMAFPEQAQAQVQNRLFPAAPKFTTYKPGEIGGTTDAAGKFTQTFAAPFEPPKLPDILVPGVEAAEIRKANATRAPEDPGSFITLQGPNGQAWSGGEKTKEAQRLGAMGWKKSTDAKPKTLADLFKDKTGVTEIPVGYRPEVGPDGAPTGKLTAAEGGPAAIGKTGFPQAYKQQMAGLDTLEQAVSAFRDKFAGAPAEVDKDGKVIKAATPGTGTEVAGGDAGALDSMYTQIMLATKNAEQAGALDQGMLNVMDQMLRKPTGAFSPFQFNSYTNGQIKTILEGITRKRANMQKAFNAGAYDADGAPPRGGASGAWSAVEVTP